jgi:hypothetical protein
MEICIGWEGFGEKNDHAWKLIGAIMANLNRCGESN